MTPGYDTALVRMDPTGEVIVTTGTCGARPGARDHVRADRRRPAGHPPGPGPAAAGRHRPGLLRLGHLGQPVVVIGGGAAGRAADAVAGQLRQVAAQPARGQPGRHRAGRRHAPGSAATPSASIAIAELARVVHFQAHRLAEDLRYGLEARATFDPPGTFSNACHAAHGGDRPGHRRDPAAPVPGRRGLRRGHQPGGGGRAGARRRHPGRGGRAARAGLLRRRRPAGQRHADGLPGAHRGGDVRRSTSSTCRPPPRFSETGAKGMGEGGTIGAPAAVLNAVNDALSGTAGPLRPHPGAARTDVVRGPERGSAREGRTTIRLTRQRPRRTS